MQSFFQVAVSSILRVQFTIERVYRRSRKTKLGDLSEIIHQKLPIFDKNSFIKAQKNSIILKASFWNRRNSSARLKNRTQPFGYKFVRDRAHVRALMTRKPCAVGMRNEILRNYLKWLSPEKKFTMKACGEFYCRQIAEKDSF